nr:MAG TPA: Pyocin activator protein PrtN [Caudoviricetes sp.]
MRPKTIETPPVTDEDILALDNVPVSLAARYLGSSTATLYEALQDERVPFGWAVQRNSNWAYHISPGGLVKYKHGELTMYKLRDVSKIICEDVSRLIDQRMEALGKLSAALLGA